MSPDFSSWHVEHYKGVHFLSDTQHNSSVRSCYGPGNVHFISVRRNVEFTNLWPKFRHDRLRNEKVLGNRK